jgi:hypothetical protein
LGLPVVLFPHLSLSEKEMMRVFSSFGPVILFQPWYMEPPLFALKSHYRDAVRILNPPAHMKPGEGFKGLLSEYKTWIKQHRDKSRAVFLKVDRGLESGGDATWEIREALRGTSRPPQHKREEQPILRWHLILHLARDMEEDRREADRVLLDLKDKESPIKGLLGEVEVKNPLADLSQFGSDPQKLFYPTELVIEAWLALFGGYLKGNERLLTFSPSVMDYVSEARDPASSRDEKRVLKRLSGKNVILMKEELGDE